jgi:Flp pilus assembly protein TadG
MKILGPLAARRDFRPWKSRLWKLRIWGARLWAGRAGSTAVEFALIAPALFMTLFAGIEFGRLLWTQSILHFAVESAARCASVTPTTCGTSSQITNYAASQAAALSIGAAAFTSSTPSCGHQVSASYSFQYIVTGYFSFTPTLTARACFP